MRDFTPDIAERSISQISLNCFIREYIDPEVIFAVLGYRIPGFLELAFPLAFLLGILLTLGRLYSENEMSIFHASGISL